MTTNAEQAFWKFWQVTFGKWTFWRGPQGGRNFTGGPRLPLGPHGTAPAARNSSSIVTLRKISLPRWHGGSAVVLFIWKQWTDTAVQPQTHSTVKISKRSVWSDKLCTCFWLIIEPWTFCCSVVRPGCAILNSFKPRLKMYLFLPRD